MACDGGGRQRVAVLRGARDKSMGSDRDDDDDIQVIDITLPGTQKPGRGGHDVIVVDASDAVVASVAAGQTRGGFAPAEWPHSRCDCANFKFVSDSKSLAARQQNMKHCPKCLCFVCDVEIPMCSDWAKHCFANPQAKGGGAGWNGDMWKRMRAALRDRRKGTVNLTGPDAGMPVEVTRATPESETDVPAGSIVVNARDPRLRFRATVMEPCVPPSSTAVTSNPSSLDVSVSDSSSTPTSAPTPPTPAQTTVSASAPCNTPNVATQPPAVSFPVAITEDIQSTPVRHTSASGRSRPVPVGANPGVNCVAQKARRPVGNARRVSDDTWRGGEESAEQPPQTPTEPTMATGNGSNRSACHSGEEIEASDMDTSDMDSESEKSPLDKLPPLVIPVPPLYRLPVKRTSPQSDGNEMTATKKGRSAAGMPCMATESRVDGRERAANANVGSGEYRERIHHNLPDDRDYVFSTMDKMLRRFQREMEEDSLHNHTKPYEGNLNVSYIIERLKLYFLSDKRHFELGDEGFVIENLSVILISISKSRRKRIARIRNIDNYIFSAMLKRINDADLTKKALQSSKMTVDTRVRDASPADWKNAYYMNLHTVLSERYHNAQSRSIAPRPKDLHSMSWMEIEDHNSKLENYLRNPYIANANNPLDLDTLDVPSDFGFDYTLDDWKVGLVVETTRGGGPQEGTIQLLTAANTQRKGAWVIKVGTDKRIDPIMDPSRDPSTSSRIETNGARLDSDNITSGTEVAFLDRSRMDPRRSVATDDRPIYPNVVAWTPDSDVCRYLGGPGYDTILHYDREMRGQRRSSNSEQGVLIGRECRGHEFRFDGGRRRLVLEGFDDPHSRGVSIRLNFCKSRCGTQNGGHRNEESSKNTNGDVGRHQVEQSRTRCTAVTDLQREDAPVCRQKGRDDSIKDPVVPPDFSHLTAFASWLDRFRDTDLAVSIRGTKDMMRRCGLVLHGYTFKDDDDSSAEDDESFLMAFSTFLLYNGVHLSCDAPRNRFTLMSPPA